jgi:hypothetical protein
MTQEELKGVITEWCEAQAQYDLENFPGGFPKYYTARRLYLAGLALYDVSGVETVDGRYLAGNTWYLYPDGTAKTRYDER